jgi:hypothetical protein
MDEGNHQKIGTRKLQLERRFDFAKARGTNERSLVSDKKKRSQAPNLAEGDGEGDGGVAGVVDGYDPAAAAAGVGG